MKNSPNSQNLRSSLNSTCFPPISSYHLIGLSPSKYTLLKFKPLISESGSNQPSPRQPSLKLLKKFKSADSNSPTKTKVPLIHIPSSLQKKEINTYEPNFYLSMSESIKKKTDETHLKEPKKHHKDSRLKINTHKLTEEFQNSPSNDSNEYFTGSPFMEYRIPTLEIQRNTSKSAKTEYSKDFSPSETHKEVLNLQLNLSKIMNKAKEKIKLEGNTIVNCIFAMYTIFHLRKV